MKTAYPAIIEKTDNQYWLEFPDLEGCQTWGDSIEEVLSNAEEALEGYILAHLENNLSINKASDIKDIEKNNDKITTYVFCEIKLKSNKLVKKTLTIPDWVDKLGTKNNVNFSQLLSDAIVQQFARR